MSNDAADHKGKQIRGHYPDGSTLTATWDGWDEWMDDHFGQGFGLSQSVIGQPPEVVLAETAHTFWDGVSRVEWIGGAP